MVAIIVAATPVYSQWRSVDLSECGDGAGELSPHSMTSSVQGVWVGASEALLELRDEDCTMHLGQKSIASVAATDGIVWASEGNQGELWRYTELTRTWQSYEGRVSGRQKRITGAPCYAIPSVDSTRAVPEVFDGIPFVPPLTKVLAARGSDLWIGYPSTAEFSILHFDGTSLACWEDPNAPKEATDIALAPSGDLWVVTREGVSVLSEGSWATSISMPGMLRLAIASDGTTWAAGEPGLFRWNGRWERMGDGFMIAVAARDASEAWAVTIDGTVLHVTRDGVSAGPSPVEADIRVAIELHEGQPWIADRSALFRLSEDGTAVPSTTWGQLKSSPTDSGYHLAP